MTRRPRNRVPLPLGQERLVDFVRMAGTTTFGSACRKRSTLSIAERRHSANSEQLHWGLRRSAVLDRDDWQRFDALFDADIGCHPTPTPVSVGTGGIGRQAGNRRERAAARPARRTKPRTGMRRMQARTVPATEPVSARLSEQSDFQSPADNGQMQEMERLVEALARRMSRRLVRRERIQRKGRRLHLRHTIRNSLPFGGTPLRARLRERRRRAPGCF